METKTDDFSPNYWIVGASFGGIFDQKTLDDFLYAGVWWCWDPKDDLPTEEVGHRVKAMREMVTNIKKGDRIAIKKMNVNGEFAGKADILAIGVVKADTDFDKNNIMKSAWRVYVEWLPLGKNGGRQIKDKRIPLYKPVNLNESIHGPYKFNNDNPEIDAWIREIFCI